MADDATGTSVSITWAWTATGSRAHVLNEFKGWREYFTLACDPQYRIIGVRKIRGQPIEGVKCKRCLRTLSK